MKLRNLAHLAVPQLPPADAPEPWLDHVTGPAYLELELDDGSTCRCRVLVPDSPEDHLAAAVLAGDVVLAVGPVAAALYAGERSEVDVSAFADGPGTVLLDGAEVSR